MTTPGVQNIENRYSSGGGKKSHLPGAATPRGSSEKQDADTQKEQGLGSQGFEERVGEQRPNVSGLRSCMFGVAVVGCGCG